MPSNGAEIYDPSTGVFSATGTMISRPRVPTSYPAQQRQSFDRWRQLRRLPPNAELYDPADGHIPPAGTYASGTFDFNTCQGSQSALLADGRVLIVFESGGANYDPSRDAFTRTDNPIVADYVDGLPSATLLMSGSLLVAGGCEYNLYTSAELFGLASETFAATGSLTSGRTLDTATLLPTARS